MSLLQESVPGDLGVLKHSGSDAALQSAVRKAALRFVPLLTIAYLFNYLDRTSLGFAALTMNQQLGLSAGQFGLAAGIFFLGYSLFEGPSNLMLYRYGARRWLARIMISWGLVSAGPRLCRWSQQFLRTAPSAGHRGSRILSRRDLLSRRLVSGSIPHPDAGVVSDRDSGILAGRRPGVRHAAADGRNLGTGRMAMAFHPGQPAMPAVGFSDALPACRSSGDRELADPR